MKKTSVYLTEDEAEALRRLALNSGRSQAELIRDGIRHVLASDNGSERRFHSMGKGRGTGSPYTPWDVDDLYNKVMEGR